MTFFLNLGYKWNMSDAAGPNGGAIFLASKNPRVRFGRKMPQEFSRMLFDPQLYLAGLDAETCAKACAQLAGYPWFGIEGVPDFDSEEMNQTEWKQNVLASIKKKWTACAPAKDDIAPACSACVDFQAGIGCTHIILPSPLVVDRQEDEPEFVNWLDHGLEQAGQVEVGQPLLATVAISDSALNEGAFEASGFLDAIVDQVTSRDGLNGVYIVIAQANNAHPFQTDTIVLRAYLHLCRAFHEADLEFVLPNFADLGGLMCMAKGASGLANGPSQNLRRLSLTDFREKGGGIAYPHLYSHKMAAELATETDLNRIVRRRLLRHVRDVTPTSQALMAVLASGGSAATVGPWVESQSNITAAQQHFVQCNVREEKKLAGLDFAERGESVVDWLENAATTQVRVQRRLNKKRKLAGTILPAERWLSLLDENLGEEE